MSIMWGVCAHFCAVNLSELFSCVGLLVLYKVHRYDIENVMYKI